MKNIYFLLIILVLSMGMISCSSPNDKAELKIHIGSNPIIEDPTDTFYIINTITSERIRIIVKNDKGTQINYPSTYMVIEQ